MLDANAASNAADHSLTVWQVLQSAWPFLVATFSALIGYWVGTLKNYYEQKQTAMVNVMPNIIRVLLAEEITTINIEEFNRSLHLMWLFASKPTAKSIDNLLHLIAHPNDGDRIKAAQAAFVQMRKELLPRGFRWASWLRSQDVQHFNFRI